MTHPETDTRLHAVLVCAVALLTLVTLAPYTASRLALVPGNEALHALQTQREVPDPELDVLIESRSGSLDWTNDPRALTDRALALQARARRELEAPVRAQALAQAEADLIAGLTRAPASPHAWFRLAQVREALSRDTGSVAQAVSMGVLTGPHAPELLMAGVRSGLASWDALEPDDRHVLRRWLVRAYETDSRLVMTYVGQTGRLDALVDALREHRSPAGRNARP